MRDDRYFVFLRQTTPQELVELLSAWEIKAHDGSFYQASKAEWGHPATHLVLLKKNEPPFPVQIPSEFVLVIVDTSTNHPSLGFVWDDQ